jgi:hypothetical protein
MTQRILKRVLIVHDDLAIGAGTVTQTRGDLTIIGQEIELVFIFRTLDEIRYLDWNRYTRVALHVNNGPLIEYVFDELNVSADNGDTILEPNPAISVGRWIKVEYSYTTTELEDITDPVNTSVAKHAGYMVWNSTTENPVWAVGSADGDLWVDATGATAHTPV